MFFYGTRSNHVFYGPGSKSCSQAIDLQKSESKKGSTPIVLEGGINVTYFMTVFMIKYKMLFLGSLFD